MHCSVLSWCMPMVQFWVTTSKTGVIYKEAFGNFWDILNTDTKTRHMRDIGRKSASPLFKLCHMLSLHLREHTGNYGTTVSGSIWSRSIFSSSSVSVFPWAEKLFVKWVNLWCLFFVVCSILWRTLSLIFQVKRFSCETPETIHAGDRGRAWAVRVI